MVLMGLLAFAAHAYQPAETPEPGPTPDAEALVRQLSDENGPTIDDVARLLREPQTVRPALLALVTRTAVPPALWRDVSVLTTSDQDPEIRTLATRAVARFATREAVALLVRLAADADPQVAEASMTALRELTATGTGWTPDQWGAWLETTVGWTDRTWARTLLAGQAEVRRRLESERAALHNEAVALHRRLHAELDPAGRTTLIAELIRDDRPWLRDLGFDLAGRDVSARTGLGEEVARAAAERLRHPEPRVRAMAANLVSRLVPPDAMILLTEALAAETDPLAAEPMLLGAARWPNPDALEPAVTWLERDDAPIDAATTALWAFTTAGLLDTPDDRARVLDRLRGLPFDRTGEPGMRMLVRLGATEDLDRVAELLTVPDGPLRSSAAEALGESPEGAGRLLAFAGDDPRLFAPASRAITRHDPTPEGLRAIAGLPSLQPDDRTRALLAHAQRLGPERLAEAVSIAGLDDTLAESVLSRLAETESPTNSSGVIDGLLALAEIRTRLSRTEAAAEAIGALDGAPMSEQQQQRFRRVRIWRRLSIGDTRGAPAVESATPQDWLDAIGRMPPDWADRSAAAEHALAHFGDQIDPESRTRIEALIAPPPQSEQDAAPQTPEPSGTTPP